MEKDKKVIRLSARVTPDVYKILKIIANDNKWSLNAAISEAIEYYFTFKNK